MNSTRGAFMHSLHSPRPIFPRLSLIYPLMQSVLEPPVYVSLIPWSPLPYQRERTKINSSYDLFMHSFHSPIHISPRLLPPHLSTCAVSPLAISPKPPQLSHPVCGSQHSFVSVFLVSRLPCSLPAWQSLSSFRPISPCLDILRLPLPLSTASH